MFGELVLHKGRRALAFKLPKFPQKEKKRKRKRNKRIKVGRIFLSLVKLNKHYFTLCFKKQLAFLMSPPQHKQNLQIEAMSKSGAGG